MTRSSDNGKCCIVTTWSNSVLDRDLKEKIVGFLKHIFPEEFSTKNRKASIHSVKEDTLERGGLLKPSNRDDFYKNINLFIELLAAYTKDTIGINLIICSTLYVLEK